MNILLSHFLFELNITVYFFILEIIYFLNNIDIWVLNIY